MFPKSPSDLEKRPTSKSGTSSTEAGKSGTAFQKQGGDPKQSPLQDRSADPKASGAHEAGSEQTAQPAAASSQSTLEQLEARLAVLKSCRTQLQQIG